MFKKCFRLVFIFLIVISLWQFSKSSVMAADCVETAVGCISYDVNGFSAWVLKLIYGIAGGIAFLLLIYGFILLGTSSGDEKKLQAAKQTITSAIIGILFLIFGLFLYRFIVINVLNIPLTGIGVVKTTGSSGGNNSGNTNGNGNIAEITDDPVDEGSDGSTNEDEIVEDPDTDGYIDDSVSSEDGSSSQSSSGDVESIMTPISSMANVSQPKTMIPCHGDMTQYQNELMEKINAVGYRTRNAVVVAANYLAAEFPYRIPYHWGGGHSDKDLDGGFQKSGSGYTTKWGCPAKSTHSSSLFDGLDCSGFVTWAYLTAGFHDVSSSKEYRWYTGNFSKISFSKSNCGIIKANIQPGDVLQIKPAGGIPHTAIVLSFDDNEIKYAQSSGSRGVNIEYIDICTGRKTRGRNNFTLISFMSNYFKRWY